MTESSVPTPDSSDPLGDKASYRQLQWTDETASRYWRWQAQFPSQYFTFQFGKLIVERLRGQLSGRKSILDYGCGVGFLVPHLASLDAAVTAVDFSPAAISSTNRRNAALTNFRGAHLTDDVVAAGGRFDAIVSVEVIEHLSDVHLESYFRTILSLLAEDGVVIITTPNQENLELSQIYCPNCDHAFHRWQHMRTWTAADLAREVEAHGLHVLEVFVTDFSLRPWRRPINSLKRVVKRILGRPVLNPHLVCVARRRT